MKIFVSYSRSDGVDFAEQIKEHLSKFKYHVFIDVNSIQGGDIWNNTIEENIAECDIFVVILTHGASISKYVEKEVLQAREQKKIIILCFHKSAFTRLALLWGLDVIQGLQFDDKYDLARKLYLMVDDIKKTTEKIHPDSKDTTTQENNFANSYQERIEKAKGLEEIGQYSKSLKIYDEVLKITPNDFEANYNKGLLHEKVGDFEDARKALDKATDIDWKHKDVWYHLGKVLEKLERYDEALEAFTSELHIDNKDIKSWTAKTNILVKLERYDEALKVLNTDLLRNNIDMGIMSIKANILEKLERNKEASKIFEKILIERQKEDGLLKLLEEGNIDAFKNKTKSYETRGNKEHGYVQEDREFTPRLIFTGKQIFNYNLKKIDLHDADLCFTLLRNRDFTDANFSWANLAGAHVDGAKFVRADLQNAYLSQTNLTKVDFSFANLSNAYFLKSNLTGTIFNNADLSNAILVGCTDYIGLECQNADFKGAIIDNERLVDHLRNNNPKNDKDFPAVIKTKKELELKLQEQGYDKDSRIYSKILERTLLKN